MYLLGHGLSTSIMCVLGSDMYDLTAHMSSTCTHVYVQLLLAFKLKFYSYLPAMSPVSSLTSSVTSLWRPDKRRIPSSARCRSNCTPSLPWCWRRMWCPCSLLLWSWPIQWLKTLFGSTCSCQRLHECRVGRPLPLPVSLHCSMKTFSSMCMSQHVLFKV